MSGGHGRNVVATRGLIAALILALGSGAFFLFVPPAPVFSSKQAADKEQAEKTRREAGCAPSRLAKMPNAAQRQAKLNACKDGANREVAEENSLTQARSVEAAEEQARQAFYQGRSTAFQSALGVLVLCATAWAAWEASRAARYAKDAAEAAQKALRHDQRVDEVQVRPYLYIVNERLNTPAVETDPIANKVELMVDASFTVYNFGHTPAKDIKLRAKAFLRPGFWNEPFDSDLASVFPVSLGDLPPDGARDMADPGMYRVDRHAVVFAAVRDEVSAVVLDGLIEYEDASGKRFETHFRRATTGPQFERDSFFITPDGNKAT